MWLDIQYMCFEFFGLFHIILGQMYCRFDMYVYSIVFV